MKFNWIIFFGLLVPINAVICAYAPGLAGIIACQFVSVPAYFIVKRITD